MAPHGRTHRRARRPIEPVRDARRARRRRAQAARPRVGRTRTGPPIVFVHGWSQSQLCWCAAGRAARSPSDFRIVTFDLRGHGMSEKPLDAGAYADARLWADDLARGHRADRARAAGAGRVVLRRLRRHRLPRAPTARRRSPASTSSAARCCCTPTFDHIGPGLLENAARRLRPGSADEHRRHPALPARLHRCGRSSDDDWSTALCWNMVVPPEVRGALIAREIDADDVLSRLSVPVLVTPRPRRRDRPALDGRARARACARRPRRLLVRGRRPHAVPRGRRRGSTASCASFVEEGRG